MANDGRSVVDFKKRARSRVSNGNAMFVQPVDGRTPTARRYRDLVAAVIDDAGGPDVVSEVVAQLARRFAALSILAEAMEAELAGGAEIDLAAFATISSTLTRLSTRIGITRKVKDITPTIQDFISSKAKPK